MNSSLSNEIKSILFFITYRYLVNNKTTNLRKLIREKFRRHAKYITFLI